VLATANQPDRATPSAGRGLGAAQRGSSGQSPGNPGREDRVSDGRIGGATRRSARRSASPLRPAPQRRCTLSRGSLGAFGGASACSRAMSFTWRFEHRAPSSERRAPSAERRAASSEQRAASIEPRPPREASGSQAARPRPAVSGSGSSSGRSPGNPGREDRVSVGRIGGASRRRALRSASPPFPAQLPGPSRGSPKGRAKCPSLRACSGRRPRSGAGLPPQRTGLRGGQILVHEHASRPIMSRNGSRGQSRLRQGDSCAEISVRRGGGEATSLSPRPDREGPQ
jgi:hypothetical protein